MPPHHGVIGPYRLVRKLGEGGMGEVYEALHETLERQVAIKFLRRELAFDKDAALRFFNEARATNRVKHPGLVQVSDFGQLPDGTAYIVMEYLSGQTLGRRMKQAPGALPLSQVLHISWQVASALAATHDKGIVHRESSGREYAVGESAAGAAAGNSAETPAGRRRRDSYLACAASVFDGPRWCWKNSTSSP